MTSLCNQFLQGYASNRFETLQRCYKRIEDVHVTFLQTKKYFLTNYSIFDLNNFEVRFLNGLASLCNQLLSGCSSIQFEISHRYYKRIEVMHVTFSRRKNNF